MDQRARHGLCRMDTNELNENTEMLKQDERWYEADYEGIPAQSSHRNAWPRSISRRGDREWNGMRMTEVQSYDPQQFWDESQKKKET